MAGISDTDLVRQGENKVPLKCSLCKHVYDVTDRLPKYLPCLHTFCAICLAYAVGRIFQCPGCQQKNYIPIHIDIIPTNFAFLNYNQLLCHKNQIKHSKLPSRQSCCRNKQTLNVSHCSDCDAYLCQYCHDNHDHIEYLKTHEVKTIEELKQLSEDSLISFFHQKRFCSKGRGHTDQRITLYCDHRNCQSPICLQCALLEHNAIYHQPINIENAVLKYKEIINGKLDKAIDKTREISLQINQINQELSNLKDNTTKQVNDVEHYFSELIKKINSRKQQLVCEIEKQHNVLQTSLNIEKKKLQMRQYIVDTSVKFTEFTLKYDSDVELLTTKYDVCSQLDKVSSQTIPDRKSTTEQFPRFFHPQSVNLNMVNNTVFSGHQGNISCDVIKNDAVVGKTCNFTITPRDMNEALPVIVRDPDSRHVETHITTKHDVTFKPTKVGSHEIVLNKYDAPADSNLYIIDVIDTKGLWKVGRTGVNNAEFNTPVGITVDKMGNVLIADAGNKRIQILDSNGKYIDQILLDSERPIGVAMALNSNIVVVEFDTKHVHIYSENREKIKQFTYKEFVKPYGVTVNSKGHILVADPKAHCIFVFTSDGDFIMKIGKEEGEGKLNNPHFVATGRNDDVIVSDTYQGLALFTKHGQFIRRIHQIGDDDKLYDCTSVAVNSDYSIIVADEQSIPHRILVLTYDGTLIRSLESQHHKLSRPLGVAVTEDG
uniref:Tripartite motif-containing protein 2-like n=1 Tax=Saccoglossus kowalevskii TaxID=10224 RepID=A0ABM0MUF2_SACKO